MMDIIADSAGILMSTVVVGELLFGFRNSSRFVENMKSLKSFLAEPEVSLLPVSLTTADHYGSLAAMLRAKGTPIPTNDIWIASHALERGVPVVSFDGHFHHIDGVEIVDPSLSDPC